MGKKIAKKIDEILATGSLKKLEKYHADPRQMAISLFSKVLVAVKPQVERKVMFFIRSVASGLWPRRSLSTRTASAPSRT